MSKAVLGFPYSGGMYGLLARENPHGSIDFKGYDYMEGLYGIDPDSLAIPTTNLAILFDEVLLTPADTHLPDFNQTPDSFGFLRNEELGIAMSADWDSWTEANRIAEELAQRHLIREALAEVGLPHEGYKAAHTISQIIMQIKVATEQQAAIVAGDGVHDAVELIFRFVKDEVSSTTAMMTEPLQVAMNNRKFAMVGLDLECKSLVEFADVKNNEEVRRYAGDMNSALHTAAMSSDPNLVFQSAIDRAMKSRKLLKRARGMFETIGITSTLASTAASISGAASSNLSLGLRGIGLASFLARKHLGRTEESQSWYLLGAKMKEVSIEQRLRNSVAITEQRPQSES